MADKNQMNPQDTQGNRPNKGSQDQEAPTGATTYTADKDANQGEDQRHKEANS